MASKRFLRSMKDRNLLYWSQGGLCAQCGQELGDDWEADHIMPWSRTHRTNVHEMQALCQACNRKKGIHDG
jgi:5-methylcytosine-specific restriction endonuclease McrA